MKLINDCKISITWKRVPGHDGITGRLGVIKNVIVINYNLITIFKVIECNCNWTLS